MYYIIKYKMEELFRDHTFNNTNQLLPPINEIIDVRVVDIYDGDTITCILNIYNGFYKYTVRLMGIDTCELKSKDELQKCKANIAKNRLYNLITCKNINLGDNIRRARIREILNTDVYLIKLKCVGLDKYGRLLGYLYDKNNINKSFNDILVEEKHAYVYFGGTKKN